MPIFALEIEKFPYTHTHTVPCVCVEGGGRRTSRPPSALGLRSIVSLEYVSIMKVIRAVSKMHAGQAGASQ